MSEPLFSIATPTRNALDKLKRCVGSVRGQTGVSCEHLIQDAQSSDQTGEWLATQADLKAVVESDSGMYDAINRAWARAAGKYVSWLNADEQYLPGTLETVDAFFTAHPAVDIIFGDYIVADRDGRPVALRREVPFRKVYVANSFLNTQSCTLFFRRRWLDDGALKFDTRFRYAADMDLILRLVEKGASIRRIPLYLSIFGIDGTNLSAHAQMEVETECIRKQYGAFGLRTMRGAVIACRRLERLWTGGYRSKPVVYRYALDEFPNYIEFKADGMGGRYSLPESQRMAAAAHTVTRT